MAALEDQELDLDKDTTENPMTDVMVIRQFCQTHFLSSNKLIEQVYLVFLTTYFVLNIAGTLQ